MKKSEEASVDRRKFLKGAAVGGMATLVASTGAVGAEAFVAPPAMPQAESAAQPSGAEVLTCERPGGDFMVDVIKSLGFEYVCRQPGLEFPRPCTNPSSTMGQQEPRVHHLLP